MNKENDLFEKCINKKTGFFSDVKDLLKKYKEMPGLTGPAGPHMMCGNNEVITWSYNDYLGLTNQPSNREIEKQSIQSAPANSPMGSRLFTNHPAFNELESAFSDFVQCEDTAVFATGYLTAIGVITALVGPGDVILLDAEGHSCLYDAAKIAMANGAKFRLFKHNDMVDLEESLQYARKNENAGILIICDGVYSMRGDLGPLETLVKLKTKYGARLLVDDAHGGGVLGNLGRGTSHHFNVNDQVDLVMHVFSKSFGSIGGSISGQKNIINYIRNNARTYIFSHSMQLLFVNKMINSLKIIQSQPNLLDTLWKNTHYLQSSLKNAGFNIGDTQSPITPIIFKIDKNGDELRKLFDFICKLRLEYNVYVSAVTYPAVPPDIALIRLTPTCLHSFQDIDDTVAAFKKAGNILEL